MYLRLIALQCQLAVRLAVPRRSPMTSGVLTAMDKSLSVAYAHSGATSSAPALSSILERSASIAETPSAPGFRKKVSFAENPIIYDISSADVYDRTSDRASTCFQLTPTLAQ